MISDLEAAQFCFDSYWHTDAFDTFFEGDTTDGVAVGVKQLDGISVVAFRGSTTLLDWARDFFAVPHTPKDHPRLGMVHAGFSIGIDSTYSKVAPLLKDKVAVVGHSLAAARALLFGGLMQSYGKSPDGITVFGEPKPGFQTLSDILAPIAVRSFKNCEDAVTHVPFSILDIRYVHPRSLIEVNVEPPSNDIWGALLGAHHMENYLIAMQNAK